MGAARRVIVQFGVNGMTGHGETAQRFDGAQDPSMTHVLLEDFMRTTATIVGVGLAALALAGCSTSAPRSTPSVTTEPTPTGTTLGAPAVGDGGRIAFAVKDDTVATIVTVNPDGSDPQKLTDGTTFDA